MIESIAHRKEAVKIAMANVEKQNELMAEANKAAEKSRTDKYDANTKAEEYIKTRDSHNEDTKKYVKAAHKALHDTKVAKKKHAKFEAVRISAVIKAKKYLVSANKEKFRRVFLDKVTKAAKIATASFKGKVIVQKEFTATAWKQYKK